MGQVCIMLHSGSRGLGHQVATDALTAMDRAMSRDGIKVNDRQLACTRINSKVPPALLCDSAIMEETLSGELHICLIPALEAPPARHLATS